MNSDTDLSVRLSRANPVTSIDSLDQGELETVAAAIEKRWHQETGRSSLQPDPLGRRRRAILVAVGTAIVAALLVALPIVLVNGGDDQSVTDSQPEGFSARIVPQASVQFAVSVALAPDGTPISLYMADGQDRAVLIACADPECAAFTETVVAEFASLGNISQLAIGGDGLPIFAFTDHNRGAGSTLGGIVHCSDLSCAERSVQTFSFNVSGSEPALAIDPQGLPAAAFGDWSTEAQVGTYQLVRCADPACQNYSAGSIPDAGGTPVIEFPEGNEPVVAFVRNRPAERTADLVMVTCGDSTCSDGGSSTVVTQAGVNHHTLDVTFADDGFPVFVFDEPKLRVARCDDASCVGEVEVSVIDLDIEFDRVIDIGDNGLPLLAYASTGADHIREVRIASCEDSACTRGTIRTLDSDQRMIGIDMVVDSTGKPVLAYQTGEALGITRCADPVCATESLRSLEWDQARFQVTEPALERAAGWERIGPFEDLSDRLNISAMATFPDGLVAVGTQGRQPTAWLSVDGTGWDEFPIAAAGDVMDVVAGGPGLIAVGATCSDFTGSSDQPCDPAIWTSPDATTWTPVMTTEAFGGCSSLASVQPDCQTWIHEIHPTATGFLANGVDIIDATWPNTSVGWTSTDGLSWQRVSTLRTDERPPYPEFVAETDWENGRYGLGTRCTGDGSRFACEPQGWISRDGMTWEPVQLDPADFGASDHAALIEDGLELTSGKFGLMAIGHNLDPTTWHETPMMFLSENGLDWTAYQLDDEMALAINDLISFGDRVIASGSRGVWAWTPPS